MTLSGSFQIQQWNEEQQTWSADNISLKTASVRQTYSGDIQGESELEYLLTYLNDSQAFFTGFETINAEINGQVNQLILRHNGTFVNGTASSQFSVISSSPLSELEGKSGHFRSGKNGSADYQFD